jgi:hypothetical protein
MLDGASVNPNLDKIAGLPVATEAYPEGEEGIQKSLAAMCRKIREGMSTAVMKSFAGNVLKQYGFPTSVYDRTAALLDFVRKNVAYAPDALGTEQIQSAAITLCVEGAPVCIPVGDCFPEGTLLLRRDGQLVPIEEICVGDEIWGDKKWSRVEGKAFKGKLKVDAIEMNNGSTMYLTPDHKVYVGRCKHGKSVECPSCHAGARVETFERIRVGDLQEGETLLQPERVAFNEHGGDLPDQLDRLYVEGLAISEGWVDGNRFCISGQDGKRKEALKHEVKTICDRLGVPTTVHRKYIRINDPEWATRVASFGHLARNKHFEALNLTEPEAAAVLRGIMSDSTANTHGKGRTFSTTSRMLMVQVRVLHRMLGRSTSVKMLMPEQHRGMGKHPLWRVGVRVKSDEHALSRNEKTLAVRSIERAVKKVPCWDIQTDDHKVYLPEHDVTVSNCDDVSVALGTLLAALGMEVRVVRQIFGGGAQQHVLIEVKDEHGKWLAADPSSRTMPVGRKAPAVKETYCSPWDPVATGIGDGAVFVGIGSLPVSTALPVLMLSHGGWHYVDHLPQPKHVGAGALVEVAPGIEVDSRGNIHVGLGSEGACCMSCANGGTCEGETPKAGIGADLQLPTIPTDVESFVKASWAGVQGRGWNQALASADLRASSGDWTGEGAKSDLVTLMISSSMNARGIVERGDETSARAHDALIRTWYVLLKRLGVSPSQGELDRAKSNTTAEVQIEIGIIAALILSAAAIAVTTIALYYASQIINNLLVKYMCDRELIRLHAEWDRIVDARRKSGTPFSEDELRVLDQLEKQQRFVFDGCKAPSSESFPWTPIAIGASIVGMVVLGVVYAPEIKGLLASRRDR